MTKSMGLCKLRFNDGRVEDRYIQVHQHCLYVYNVGPENSWVFDKVYDLFDVHTRTYKNQGVFVTLVGEEN